MPHLPAVTTYRAASARLPGTSHCDISQATSATASGHNTTSPSMSRLILVASSTVNDALTQTMRNQHQACLYWLCRYLEEELARRYRDAAPATLALLQDRCAALAAELALAESRVNAIQDVASLRGEGTSCYAAGCRTDCHHIWVPGTQGCPGNQDVQASKAD